MINKKRIGHYIPQYGTNTGTGQVLENLCNIFRNHGNIELVIFKSGNEFNILIDENITIISIPSNRFEFFPPIKFIRIILKNVYSLNVLSIHMPFNPQNFLVHLFSKIPIDYLPHGCFNPQTLNRPKKKIKKTIYYNLFERKILEKSRKIICATHKEEIYIKNLGFNNTVVAHFPFKLPVVNETLRKKFRCTNQFSDNDFLIIFVGRFDIYTKGLDILVQAIKKANVINQSIKCVLIGYNNAKPKEINNLINKHNCQNCVFDIGKTFGDEKYDALLSSNLYVQPSRYESFGVSILEALSLKIPCLISEGCDISSSIHEANGCYIYMMELLMLYLIQL